jgi:predicted ATPase
LIGQENDEPAAEEVRRGLAAWQSTGAQLMRPHFVALLVEACAPTRRDDQGLRLLDEALALCQSTGERYYEAELCRLKGERLLKTSRGSVAVEAAEASFQQAIDIAKRQQARSLELRAAISLARLHCDRGRHELATDLIAPICEQFTEGFETPDLREANALLDPHP